MPGNPREEGLGGMEGGWVGGRNGGREGGGLGAGGMKLVHK